MIITIDIGNSRVKLAQWQASVIVARSVQAYGDKNLSDVFDELFTGIKKPEKIFAVCVSGDENRKTLADWVERQWQLPVGFLKTEKRFGDIVNAYDDPSHHGADRWASLIASHQLFPDAAICVIGAGTAITFDLMDGNGGHLGEYILPSYVTMHQSLLGDTANINSDLSAKYIDNTKVPNNTNDAVNDGLHKLLQAGVRELCSSATSVLGSSVKIIITGGFAQTILSYPEVPEMHHQPDLVMQGLYVVMNKVQAK